MPWSYVSRDALKARRGDSASLSDATYRSVLQGVARAIDHHCRRTFRIYLATRYFRPVDSCKLRIPDLQTITSLKTDEDGDRVYETEWAPTDYDLLPDNAPIDMEPYTAIGVAPNGRYSFPTEDKSTELVAKWGWFEDLETLPSTLNGALTSSATTVAVTSGDDFDVLDTIQVDSEQMYVTAIAANNLTVERAQNGTSAAAHLTAAVIKRHRYPDDVVQAAVIQGARIFGRKDTPFGIAGGGEMGMAGVIVRLDPDVRQLLDAFVNRKVG